MKKDIVFRDGTATIIEVKKWDTFASEQIQIATKHGLVLVTPSFDTKRVDDSSKIIVKELLKT